MTSILPQHPDPSRVHNLCRSPREEKVVRFTPQTPQPVAMFGMMAFISNLPVELLIHVFRLYISSYRPNKTLSQPDGPVGFSSGALCTLTSVCRHWHAIVHNTPSLWAVLDLRSEKRTAKMLEMSGRTPLIVHASTPRFRVLDTVWHRRINSIVEENSRRLVELHLTAPGNYITNALEVAGSGAPMLRSLKISGRSNGPVTSSVLPDAVQDWVAPQLDEIILTWFGISWTSPLLTSCAHRLLHLDINLRPQFDFDTSTVIPTFQEFTDQLRQMTSLRTLSLRNCLPTVLTDTEIPSFRIALPSLDNLHLVGSVPQCHSVWSMLDLPQRYQLSLGCTTEDPATDIPQLFPKMETFLRGLTGLNSATDEVIRSLSIEGSFGLHCQLWSQPSDSDPPSTPNPMPTSPPLLYLSFTTNESEGAVEVLPVLGSFLTAHILPHVHSLQLAGLPGLRAHSEDDETEEDVETNVDWISLLGAATKLTALVLQDLCPRRITSLLSDFTSAGSKEVGFPLWTALEDLYLDYVQFYYTGPPPPAPWDPPPPSREDGEVTFQALKRCLLDRKEAGVGPNFLSISDSHSMTPEWYAELKEAVSNVVWDEIGKEMGGNV